MDLQHPLFEFDPTAADPHEEARRMRAVGGCVPATLLPKIPAWVTTDESTGRIAFTHPALVKGAEYWRDYREGRVPEDSPMMALVVGATMVNRDGADHARLRGPVQRAFGRRLIEDFAPRIRRFTDDLLDDLALAPPGAVTDLRAGLAYPLPMTVICHLLGIDDAGLRERFGRNAATLLRSTATAAEIVTAHTTVMELLGRLVAAKAALPGDDLTARLIRAHRDGELSESELLDSLLLLVVAGHDTSVGLITNAVTALLAHPDQLARVRDGSYGWSDVIGETLRYDPPVQRIMIRFAGEDLLLGGATVRAGDPVIIGLAGAGRDPAAHPDADRFDITRRQTGTPIHFGLGPHYCLGAPLARLEAETVLGRLFDRFPDLALADGPPPRMPSLIMNTVASLPVVLKP